MHRSSLGYPVELALDILGLYHIVFSEDENTRFVSLTAGFRL